jgi:hypothetical protein
MKFIYLFTIFLLFELVYSQCQDSNEEDINESMNCKGSINNINSDEISDELNEQNNCANLRIEIIKLAEELKRISSELKFQQEKNENAYNILKKSNTEAKGFIDNHMNRKKENVPLMLYYIASRKLEIPLNNLIFYLEEKEKFPQLMKTALWNIDEDKDNYWKLFKSNEMMLKDIEGEEFNEILKELKKEFK